MISKNQVKQIQSLHLKKNRDNNRLFLVEGVKGVKELLEHGKGIVHELYATSVFARDNFKLIENSGADFFEVSESELKQISMQTTPNNVLAVCNYFDPSDGKFDFNSGFSFYLDDVRDPGNFGTIIRLADWYGVPTIFCSPESCDLYNPKVIQSTMGAFLRINVVYARLSDLLAQNTPKNVYGAVLNGQNIYKEKLQNGLIVIGNEANGISDENMAHVTRPLTIPSHSPNGAESLNAAMATSIIASEFFRQLKY